MERIRSFFHNNMLLKAAALLLSIIIWSMVNNAITMSPNQASLPEERTVLHQIPVLVLGPASSQSEAILKPPAVDVTVKGALATIRQLSPSQVTVYVNTSSLTIKGRYRQQLQYSVNASGVQVDRISPPVVEVELR